MLGGFFVYRHLTSGPPVVLPRPQLHEASASGAHLLPNGWTNSPAVVFAGKPARATSPISANLEVEVRGAGDGFSDSPTNASAAPAEVAAGCSPAASCPKQGREPVVRVKLGDGSYRWQARLRNDQGVSPWAVFPGTLNIDTKPPVITTLSSSTDPNPKKLYHSSTMSFSWQGMDRESGIAGYSYALDHDAQAAAKPDVRTASDGVTLRGLATGIWYFHVRPLDRAGNWGTTSTYPVRIDVTPPGLARVQFNLFQLDPQFDTLRMSFAVTRAARSVRVGVYRQSDHMLVRLFKLSDVPKNQTVSLTWNGKDPGGRVVSAGSYDVYMRAVDKYGHSSLSGWHGFVIDYKRIVVSLGQQRLWAYDGSGLFLSSLVTTGNRELPTPQGLFHILGKFHPFTFRSPWPPSSPYYYPPSLTQWTMLFKAGGYFIHDAPWRNNFGPGSNAAVGKPGSDFTGTHGCINVPADVAYRLFHWAQEGTVVQVTR